MGGTCNAPNPTILTAVHRNHTPTRRHSYDVDPVLVPIVVGFCLAVLPELEATRTHTAAFPLLPNVVAGDIGIGGRLIAGFSGLFNETGLALLKSTTNSSPVEHLGGADCRVAAEGRLARDEPLSSYQDSDGEWRSTWCPLLDRGENRFLHCQDPSL
jgi:hypothetical protein